MKLWELLLIGLTILRATKGQTTVETVVETTTSQFESQCHGYWSPWTECFPGTLSNDNGYRDRIYNLFPSQYEATECDTSITVNSVQTQSCTSSGTPIEDLASSTCPEGQYQCTNHRCIPIDYMCNGDDDCGDNSDEYPTIRPNCTLPEEPLVCGLSQAPSTGTKPQLGERYLTGIPGLDHFSVGYDILTGGFRSNILSMSGHGSCRRVLIAGSTDTYYRLPQNVASLRQMFDIAVDTGRIYESGASWLNATRAALQFNLNFGGQVLNVSGKAGLTQSDFLKGIVTQSLADDQSRSYASVDTTIATAQVILQEPSSLEVSTAFMSRVMDLPDNDFSYSMYLNFIKDFGTHYVTSGKLGGNFVDMEVHSKCWLDNGDFEDYSSLPWREIVRDCVRQSFFKRLNPDTTTLSTNCQSNINGVIKTLREEAVDYYVTVTGGSVDTSSDLKFSFSKETWDAWIKTIVNSPTLSSKDFTLGKISNLIFSSSINMEMERKQKVASYIDQAVSLYLNPYDAETLCHPCPAVDTDLTEYDDNGEEVSIFNYGVAYVTGTGEDYKCQCVYNSPLDVETCGALQNMATLITLLMSLIAAYWNVVGH